MLIADRTQPRNSTAIKRTAVRGPGVSLDNVGAQLKAPFKPLGTSQIYGTEGFKESPQFVSLSNSRWKNFQLRNFRTEIFLQTGKFFQTGKFRRLEKKFQTGNFCRLEKIFRLEIFADWKLLQTGNFCRLYGEIMYRVGGHLCLMCSQPGTGHPTNRNKSNPKFSSKKSTGIIFDCIYRFSD